jgi:hypothetical protein
MTKRVLAGILWVYATWYAWSLYAGLADINVLWGPVIALSVVAFIAALRVRQAWAESSITAPRLAASVQSGEPA